MIWQTGVLFGSPGTIPLQMNQKSFYSLVEVQGPSETINIILSIPALPTILLTEVEHMIHEILCQF